MFIDARTITHLIRILAIDQCNQHPLFSHGLSFGKNAHTISEPISRTIYCTQVMISFISISSLYVQWKSIFEITVCMFVKYLKCGIEGSFLRLKYLINIAMFISCVKIISFEVFVIYDSL